MHDSSKDLAEDLYEAYCRQEEEGRVARLRITLGPQARRNIADRALLEREEFYRRLAKMRTDQREEFIQIIRMDYDAASM